MKKSCKLSKPCSLEVHLDRRCDQCCRNSQQLVAVMTYACMNIYVWTCITCKVTDMTYIWNIPITIRHVTSCLYIFMFIKYLYIYIFLYTNENGKATHSPEPSNQSHVVFTWNGKPRSHEETSSKAAHLPNIPTNKITSIYSICRLSHQVEKSIYGPWIWEFFFFC